MPRVMRGWTLHEMIISLSVTACVVALAVHASLGQLRFFRGVGEIAAVEGQLAQATGVVRAALWSASPAAGDLLVAQDTALELRVTMGSSVVCESAAGRMLVAAPGAESGAALASFVETPEVDDIVAAWVADSAAVVWLTLRVAAPPVGAGPCPRYPSATGALLVTLAEQVIVPPGSVLRFLRPMRLSIYHASDSRWYLGARDWNGAAQRFNTIQPVAGPLAPPGDVATAGLRLEYLDAAGLPLDDLSDTRRVAGVRVLARGASLRTVSVGGIATTAAGSYTDSASATIALRNAR